MHSGRTTPTAYNDAKLTTLGSSKNATHWTVEVLCTGCSKWRTSPRGLSTTDVNTFAWAVSRNAVPQPASNSSSFPMHTNMGNFPADLAPGKTPKAAFQAYVTAATSAAGRTTQ
jgi:cellobiose dehydrogenase-like cytochrome